MKQEPYGYLYGSIFKPETRYEWIPLSMINAE